MIHFVSHATPALVQNMPATLPLVPVWHRGRDGSLQALLSAHAVVQAANSEIRLEQLKQVVPAAHGWPQSATKLVHLPCTQATPALSLKRRREPSSAMGCCAAHPQAGYPASHAASSVWNRAFSELRNPMT